MLLITHCVQHKHLHLENLLTYCVPLKSFLNSHFIIKSAHVSISKQSQHAIINISKRNRCHSRLRTPAVTLVHWLEIPHKETMKSSVGMVTFGNKPAAVLSISGLWKSLITAVRVFFAIKVMYMRSFYLFFEMISALPMQMFFFFNLSGFHRRVDIPQ